MMEDSAQTMSIDRASDARESPGEKRGSLLDAEAAGVLPETPDAKTDAPSDGTGVEECVELGEGELPSDAGQAHSPRVCESVQVHLGSPIDASGCERDGRERSAVETLVFWVKWVMTFLAFLIKKKTNGRRFDLYNVNTFNDPQKLGFVVPDLEIQLESPFPESQVLIAADEIFFYGVNSKSEYLVVRIARGCNQEAEAWLHLKLEDGKVYKLAQTSGFQQSLGESGSTFSCGGLQMHYLCPMRRWRIVYCGMLEEHENDNEVSVKTAFVKFVFLWKASSDVYDLSSDLDSQTVARCLAGMEWRFPYCPRLKKFSETLNTYFQSGVLTGLVTVDDSDHEMYLYGEKVRHLGKSSTMVGSKFKHLSGNIPKNGLIFHIGESTVPNVFHDLSFGFVVRSSGDLKPVQKAQILLPDEECVSSLNASFSDGEHYELIGKVASGPIALKSRQGWIGSVELYFVDFTVGSNRGSGIFMAGEVSKVPQRDFESKDIHFPEAVPLIVNFHDEISHFPTISGGKGSSLGKLTKLSKEDKSFVVPKGIILTTSAYREFLNLEIEKEIENLEDVVYGKVEGDMLTACERAMSVIIRTTLPHKICKEIERHLNTVFDGRYNRHKFAVRSSSTGEDTKQMSAAGQMDTFLGIHGLKDIFAAVKKCWASQFAFPAVEYKRHNGQVLNLPMAVVIQDMAACDVAGVLFTCDPVTKNPSVISIAANYGLGESVVSGSEEPDTIFLHRTIEDEIILKSVIIGAKKHRTVMQDNSLNGGILSKDVSEDERNQCCLSTEMAEKLGKLAVKIEKYYMTARDIEWGVLDDTIYILQSRPVTSGHREIDFEIKHEFDAPIRCEGERFTVCNIGEVMPGATTPLGMDLIMKYFRTSLIKSARDKKQLNTLLPHRYFASGFVPFYNHMMGSVADMMCRFGDPSFLTSQGMAISIFGRLLEDEEMFEIANERYPKKPNKSLKASISFLKDLFFAPCGEKPFKKYLDRDFFSTDYCETSEEIFSAILNSCSVFDEAFEKHISCSQGSSSWNIFLFALLGSAKGGYDTEVYSDFAWLLSTCKNVLSADVPTSIQNIAHSVLTEMSSGEFKAMSTEKALAWFQTSTSVAGAQFREFLRKHGHRCLKECDVHSKSWAMDPKPLVTLLQNLCGTREHATEKEEDHFDKLLSELHVPLDFTSRCLLKFLLPNCRRAVGERERWKSLVIKSFDNWRKGFRNLGKMMVYEGRIPHIDLIYFLTIDEIKDLLQSRSPQIITRAAHRRKLFPVMDGYLFPDMMKGMPKPINEQCPLQNYDFVPNLTMQGIPVSRGVAQGYARVAMTLEEAADLKPGEVLIAYSTDIGWSPYFPILSGVATELGGLISHGAVVSREYGLPCVVGLHEATRHFQTGDYILLDGDRGLLQRLPEPEEE